MGRRDLVCYRVAGDALEEISSSTGTLDELSQELPQGVYTTFRTYPGRRALRLAEHLRRLEESARLLGHTVALDHARLRRAMAMALDRSGFVLARLRVTIGFPPPGETYIALAPFQEPPHQKYELGVRVVTATSLTRHTPRAKTTGFVAAGAQARSSAPGTEEVLLVDASGSILEGTSSNFFALVDGRLRTAGEGILEGITRSLVLEVAAEVLPVEVAPVTVAALAQVTEAFITSASRAVLPVVVIDGRPVGAGVPGPITRELGRRYHDRVERELEPLGVMSSG